ncbi:hypothetical protein NP493_1700g00004 [Ridgeia piscesae]|uniref:G-protein coupled receptors family 1 profile domain-containing protein n=1 Tax=Ridgeia piscesae TaxID=27915 RepID=A0AAD9NA33_RIDPI|nr:hypothetical protein NP493_1700g00004 [Ridgeia piscesae]
MNTFERENNSSLHLLNTTNASASSMDPAMGLSPAGTTIYRVILPIVCTCGILGITLTIVILSRKHMCTSTNCYLMALAVADLLFLLLFATILADNQFVLYSKEYYNYTIYINYAVIFMQIFLLASIWLTVVLAMERYIAICQPFLAAKMCTVNKARVIIILIYMFALICRMPNFWESRVVTIYDKLTNTTLTYIEATQFSINRYYMIVYPWVIDGILTSILPFLLLFMLNVRLVWEVRKSTRYIQRNLIVEKSAANVIQREELQITIMLISIIIVFLTCQAPYVIYTAIVSINAFQMATVHFMLFRYITQLLLTLKSAINFILYCWFSEKFWTTLKKVFCIEQCLFMQKPINLDGVSQNGTSYCHLRSLNGNTRDTVL